MVNKKDQLTAAGVLMTPDGYQSVCVPSNQAPSGAVRMSQLEVINVQQKKIEAVPLEEKTWLRLSQYLTMGTSLISASIINAHFRRKFHIKFIGSVSTVPVLLIPSIFARGMDYFLTQRVLLLPECQGCLEVKSGVINTACTILPTLLLSSSVSVYLAKRHHTYVISNNLQPTIKRIVKSTPANYAALATIAAVSFGIGALNRRKQRQELNRIMKKGEIAERHLLEQLR